MEVAGQMDNQDSGHETAIYRPTTGKLIGGLAATAGAGAWLLYSHLTGDVQGGFYPFAATAFVVAVGGAELAERWRDKTEADT